MSITKILVLESEPLDQLLLQRHFEGSDSLYHLEFSKSIEDALTLLSKTWYSIIFCTYNLPDGSALNFLLKFKRLKYLIPVVIMSSSLQEQTVSLGIKQGANNFLHKFRLNRQIIKNVIDETINYYQKVQSLNARLIEIMTKEGDSECPVDYGDGVIRVDSSGVIKSISGHTLSLIEENPQRLKGRVFLERFGKMAPRLIESYRLTQKDSFVSETVKIGPVYLSFEFTPVRSVDDDDDGMIVQVKDVTMMIRAEEAFMYYVKLAKRAFVGTDSSLLAEGKNQNNGNYPDKYFIKSKSQYVAIKPKEILWIEAYGDFVKVHCSGKVHVVLHKLADALTNLPWGDFARVHRSYVVRIDQVDEINATSLNIGKKSIPIGRSYKKNYWNR
jgi:CheY-like chemotaxis protein